MLDSLGAFVPNGNIVFEGAGQGPLKGYGFALKDIFDLQGQVTGFGNPDWACRRRPSSAHAQVVSDLLGAGAMVVGKTITDEFAYSLNGQNKHYGTPTNPEAPGRIPGGSSSGSASAVAGGLVDFALGSDTAGSIRVPGSYCGLFGLRTTHNRVSRQGVLPLAGSFDSVGWFARGAALLEAVGHAVLGTEQGRGQGGWSLLVAQDAFDLLEPPVQQALFPACQRLEQYLGGATPVRLAEGLDSLSIAGDLFRIIQSYEVWQNYGAWITRVKPDIAPDIQQRFDHAQTVTQTGMEEAQATRDRYAQTLRSQLDEKNFILLPSTPGIAPLMQAGDLGGQDHRIRLLALNAPASLAGLPQMTLPLASFQGCPLGLSLIAAPQGDEELLAFARAFTDHCDGEAGPLTVGYFQKP